MKIIAAILIALMLTACGRTINETAIATANEFCEEHKGVREIKVGFDYVVVYCRDGERTSVYKKSGRLMD